MKKVKCDYCENPAELVSGEVIYPHRSDLFHLKFWKCTPCKAYVGCHKPNKKFGFKGTEPLGRLANATLRKAKSEAHATFDPLWGPFTKKKLTRKEAYRWLAAQLKIKPKDCHIGMFDLETCEKVVMICNKSRGFKG